MIADNHASAVYYNNLAAAYLKLEKFKLARGAAHDALKHDCRSAKARYRRAIASKGMGFFPPCLIDLYNVLVMDPKNTEARSTLIETLRTFETPPTTMGNERLSSDIIPALDFPHAYGLQVSIVSASKQRRPEPVPRETMRKSMSCSGCSALKDRSDVKFCKKVGRCVIPLCVLDTIEANEAPGPLNGADELEDWLPTRLDPMRCVRSTFLWNVVLCETSARAAILDFEHANTVTQSHIKGDHEVAVAHVSRLRIRRSFPCATPLPVLIQIQVHMGHRNTAFLLLYQGGRTVCARAEPGQGLLPTTFMELYAVIMAPQPHAAWAVDQCTSYGVSLALQASTGKLPSNGSVGCSRGSRTIEFSNVSFRPIANISVLVCCFEREIQIIRRHNTKASGGSSRPMHKLACPIMASHKVLLHAAEKLTRHSYMRHLLTRYATLALGILHPDPLPCRGVLIVTVGMVADLITHAQRLTIQCINAVPLIILPASDVEGFDESCRPMLASNSPGMQAIRMLISPNIGEAPSSFNHMEVAGVHVDHLVQARQFGFTFDLYSHSFRTTRSFPMDLDVLFRALRLLWTARVTRCFLVLKYQP
ncbi:hypothetical protein C8R44DRAFT_724387 [Mycena epipterygia]|nr:hypothetical protein C8R44DRAFT_724387 [Mycena epipterygia]